MEIQISKFVGYSLAMITGKFVALNEYIVSKKPKITNLSLQLKKVERRAN